MSSRLYILTGELLPGPAALRRCLALRPGGSGRPMCRAELVGVSS